MAESITGINSEGQANYLFESLVGAANAALPDVDLFDEAHDIPWDANSDVLKPVEKVTIEEVVSEFHLLMKGLGEELKKEFDAGRITGAKYAETYLALTQGAMQGAIQFALGKDNAFLMAAKTQADAITARNQNEVARMETMNHRAQYALTKLKLSTEDSTFGQSEFQRQQILPAQKQMIDEQKESQRAQTSNNRSDGPAVAGLLGTQKSLYEQQIQSYKDDTRIKATKIFSDLWITQHTVNEGVPPVDAFNPKDEDGATTTHSADFNVIFQSMRSTAIGS